MIKAPTKMLVHVLHRQGGDQAETFTQLSFKEACLTKIYFGGNICSNQFSNLTNIFLASLTKIHLEGNICSNLFSNLTNILLASLTKINFAKRKILFQISFQILLTSRQRQISWPLSIIVPSEMHLRFFRCRQIC